MVEVGSFVEDFGGGGEDEEAVGEAFGDPEELQRVWLKVEAFPFAEGGRIGSKVYGDVPDVAGEDAHEFALGFA